MQERRREARVSVPIPVALLLPERVEGTCRDINLGGMFVEAERVLGYGSRLTVLLRLPGFEHEVAVEGTVRWHDSGGMGIQFGMMGARETAALLDLIKRCTTVSGVHGVAKAGDKDERAA
jgi:hypothetical protein